MKTRAAFFVFLAALALLRAEEVKPLTLTFPPPKLIGTPAPIKVPHLEEPDAAAPVIPAPAGVKNLAAGRPVTSSISIPIMGEHEFIVDGDKSPEEGFYVELDEGLQWVQVDLGASAEIFGIGLWHYHGQARAYHDVIVQVSDDPEFKDGVATIYNNDHDNSAGFGSGGQAAYIEHHKGRLIDGRRTVGRYVRFYSQGNTTDGLNHYIEVEIFGKPTA